MVVVHFLLLLFILRRMYYLLLDPYLRMRENENLFSIILPVLQPSIIRRKRRIRIKSLPFLRLLHYHQPHFHLLRRLLPLWYNLRYFLHHLPPLRRRRLLRYRVGIILLHQIFFLHRPIFIILQGPLSVVD